MTAYVVSLSTSASFQPGSGPDSPILCTLSPVLYEIKLIQAEYTLTAVGSTYPSITPTMNFTPTVYRYASGTASSGTSITPVALRQGSPSPSTTSRWGTGVGVSGTQTYISSPDPIKTSPPSDVGLTWTAPFDLTVSPGGVLLFTTGSIGGSGAGSGHTNSGRVQIILYFEEYRLAWQY